MRWTAWSTLPALLLVLAPDASAQSAAAGIPRAVLDYQVAEGLTCPTADALRAAIANELGYDAFDGGRGVPVGTCHAHVVRGKPGVLIVRVSFAGAARGVTAGGLAGRGLACAKTGACAVAARGIVGSGSRMAAAPILRLGSGQPLQALVNQRLHLWSGLTRVAAVQPRLNPMNDPLDPIETLFRHVGRPSLELASRVKSDELLICSLERGKAFDDRSLIRHHIGPRSELFQNSGPVVKIRHQLRHLLSRLVSGVHAVPP